MKIDMRRNVGIGTVNTAFCCPCEQFLWGCRLGTIRTCGIQFSGAVFGTLSQMFLYFSVCFCACPPFWGGHVLFIFLLLAKFKKFYLLFLKWVTYIFLHFFSFLYVVFWLLRQQN